MDPAELFEEEYQRATSELRLDPRRAHFADLASTKSQADWSRLRKWILSRVRVIQASAEYVRRSPRLEGAPRVLGAEVPLESRSLRLRGKADRIRQLRPRLFEVRDFKTGATLDEDGQIKAEIALQLRAYGLLLLERLPEVEIRLVVDDGVERELSFDAHDRQAAKAALERITNSMPPFGRAPSAGLTHAGSACWGCSVRHVCSEYRSRAPSWWREYPAEIERLSYDVWGTVIDVFGAGPVDVVLRDDAGRRVRIDRIDERHSVSASAIGRRLWFFGLEASGVSRGFDGTRYHPRCFHELPRDRLERRAWSMQVFRDDG
jgi:hypothetical protein